MNTNMTVLRWLSKIVGPCALDESSLSIQRVKKLNSATNLYWARLPLW